MIPGIKQVLLESLNPRIPESSLDFMPVLPIVLRTLTARGSDGSTGGWLSMDIRFSPLTGTEEKCQKSE